MRTHSYTLAEVERMHETALSRRSAEELAAVGADLGALAAATALRNRQSGKTDLPPDEGLEAIFSPDAKVAFEVAFDNTQQLFDRIGLELPSPEQFSGAGVDFAHLGAEFERMEDEGLQPKIIATVHGLGASVWRTLYENLQNDSIVNRDGTIKNGGLYIDSTVAENWNKLDQVPPTVLGVPYTGTNTHTAHAAWTIRLVPGTDRPTNTNVDHAVNNGTHPTITEYLTLQANCLQERRPPIDSNTWTWLNGTFGNGQAPLGAWLSDYGQVRVYWSYVDYRYAALGSRLPVWGVEL